MFGGASVSLRRMNLHHVELFYYVARHGGISRAVRNMPYGIQQPAVSSQILALEEDLGTRLFERNPFRLTPAGQELYEFARPFFDNLEPMRERLRARQAPRLRLAASELILRDYLPAVMERMRRDQPELAFTLKSGSRAEMDRWLAEHQVDLTITPLDQKPAAGVKSLLLVELPLVLLVPRSSPVKSAAELWARDPVGEPLICIPDSEEIAQVFQRGLKKHGVVWPVAIEAHSLDLVSQYVGNGYGLGLSVQLSEHAKNRRVRALPLPGFDPVKIVALWRAGGTPVHDALRAAIEERARELWPERA